MNDSFKYQQERERHYEVIGSVLLQAEACSSNVGIPWLFPTKRVRELRRTSDRSDLEEFIKINLVTVHTTALETYCDDLESLSDEQSSLERLHIRLYSRVERWGFTGLLATFFGCSLVIFASSVFEDWGTATLFGIIGALIGGMIGMNFSCDRARRTSFYLILQREISRRQGTAIDGKARVAISSADAKALK